MDKHACRACRGSAGHLVLDLGEQPACDYFPRCDDPGPDPVYPLQMWLCSSCGLAQLLADPTVPEEPRGTEPAALVAQAADAVQRVAAAGWLPERGVVAEYGSPHGGSWLGLLAARGLVPADDGEQADVILDCFGMMHAADQRAGTRRARGPDSTGRSAAAAVPRPEHDHPRRAVERAPARALRVLLDDRADRHAGRGRLQPAHGLAVRSLRRHRAARRDPGRRGPADRTTRSGRCSPRMRSSVSAIPAPSRASSGISRLMLSPCMTGSRPSDPPARRSSATAPHPGRSRCCARRTWIAPSCPRWSTPRRPSRACGCREPTSRSPPRRLAADPPDAVLLFVPDLLAEVRAAFPEVEAAGGRWVDAATLGS